MQYKMIYIYDNVTNLDNVPSDKLVEDLVTGDITEAISNIMELKRHELPIPVGFTICAFDEYDLEGEIESKTYYINGTILNKNTIPPFMKTDGLFSKDVQELVLVKQDFCIPFHRDKDTILTIPNL